MLFRAFGHEIMMLDGVEYSVSYFAWYCYMNCYMNKWLFLVISVLHIIQHHDLMSKCPEKHSFIIGNKMQKKRSRYVKNWWRYGCSLSATMSRPVFWAFPFMEIISRSFPLQILNLPGPFLLWKSFLDLSSNGKICHPNISKPLCIWKASRTCQLNMSWPFLLW